MSTKPNDRFIRDNLDAAVAGSERGVLLAAALADEFAAMKPRDLYRVNLDGRLPAILRQLAELRRLEAEWFDRCATIATDRYAATVATMRARCLTNTTTPTDDSQE